MNIQENVTNTSLPATNTSYEQQLNQYTFENDNLFN